MRRVIRWVDPEGYVSVGVEHPRDGEFSLLRGIEDSLRLLQGESFPLGERLVPADEFSLELEPGLTLIAPIDPPELWCAEGTYDTGDADPVGSSPFREVYTSAAENHRPRLLLKDAGGRRTVGPGHAIGIRGDSTWTVPEPEIAVVIGGKGTILGYTIANDVTSREIESANPLRRNTEIMRWFSGRTSATNVVTPCRAASCASWPSRIDPIPRPWYSSPTEKLTSARPPSIRRYCAPPIS